MVSYFALHLGEFIVFLQSVMVITVSVDTSTVTVSVRITVNALKKVPPNVVQVSLTPIGSGCCLAW